MTPDELLRQTVADVCMYLASRGIEPHGRTVLEVVRYVVERCEAERDAASRAQASASSQLAELEWLRRAWREQWARVQELEQQVVALRLKEAAP